MQNKIKFDKDGTPMIILPKIDNHDCSICEAKEWCPLRSKMEHIRKKEKGVLHDLWDDIKNWLDWVKGNDL